MLSLEVIESVLSRPDLAGWNGFGVVVQAYSKRAPEVIDWLYQQAVRLDRQIMVRLVKGAYWDAEIKRAQVMGLADYPVYTTKAATDLSYLAVRSNYLACWIASILSSRRTMRTPRRQLSSWPQMLSASNSSAYMAWANRFIKHYAARVTRCGYMRR